MVEPVTPNMRRAPPDQRLVEGSNVIQSGAESEPFAFICQPRTVMLLEFSRSMPPSRLVLAVAKPEAATPGPPELTPTPSNVTPREFSTRTPQTLLLAVVWPPYIFATTVDPPAVLMWFSVI